MEYKIKEVISYTSTNNLDEAIEIACERTSRVNKSSNLAKVNHTNEFLLTGFLLEYGQFERWLEKNEVKWIT